MWPREITPEAAVSVRKHGLARTQCLLVPGLGNSEPSHWQSRWQPQLRAERVDQADWYTPDLEPWAAAVEAALLALSQPAMLVAHSFGCLASVVAATRQPARVRALFLVAPADPARFDCAHALIVAPDAPARLVASRDDPYMAFDQARRWARQWQAELVDAGAVGHINPDSGHGDWPDGLKALAEFCCQHRMRVA